MPLASGEQLGHYKIQSLIGKGGMGEVYRALDTKLERDVAIKVLPAPLAGDPERLARFEREAKVLAQLNHPRIAAIHGVEDRALVMELVPGPTLADRITQGPIPAAEAESILLQIAEALEYAHERGVIHRDLKPANIKIDPDDKVKILDFGLAKALIDPGSSITGDPTNSPTVTLTIGGTVAGTILGTAAYMAPEQARGKKMDKRADIWAFGVVAWEMLTGERLFQGEDTVQVLSRVLEQPVDLERVPVTFRKLLGRCLDQNVKDRLRDIGEARFLLEEPALTPTAEVAPGPSRSRFRAGAWAALAVMAIALAVVSFLYFRESQKPQATLRYTIAAPEKSRLHSFAVSPDGRLVVMAANLNGKYQLWLRRLDALQGQPMALTEGATYPFWSPDSRYIGFFADGRLKKIAASGGPSQSLCDAPNGRGGSWNRDDVIVFSPSNLSTAIQRVAAAGGVPADVTTTKGIYKHPVFLPDGRRFLYVIVAESVEKNGIYVASLDGKENRRLLTDNSAPVFASASSESRNGHLLFIRDNTLMAQPFDAGTAQISGHVFPVAEDVALTTNLNYAPVTASENRVLLYQAGDAAGNRFQFVWYDRSGKLLGPVGAPGLVGGPAISPDEKTMAFARSVGLVPGTFATGSDIWLRDLTRGTEIRFTSDVSRNSDPFWSPKGDRIVFESSRGGHAGDLYQKAASGSGQDELLLATPNPKRVSQWSRDGRFIVYTEADAKTRNDLWVLPLQAGQAPAKPIPFLQTEFNEVEGQLSPDSRWMAYVSDVAGTREIYVRPFPAASEGVWRISTASGEFPRWKGDGKELFYVAPDGKMMAVAVKAAISGPKPVFEPGTPEPLFDSHITGSTNAVFQYDYDVTADGKRFLVSTTGSAASASAPPLTVVVNWSAGLRK
jgi:serine/threonine protein kinase/Tol biopolymer transport system component